MVEFLKINGPNIFILKKISKLRIEQNKKIKITFKSI